MRKDSGLTEKLKEDILSVVARHLDLGKYKVFIFGSRATGGGSDRSDIDIGIEGNSPVSTEIMSRIRDELESLPTIYTIDVVDLAYVSNDFRRIALEKVVPLN